MNNEHIESGVLVCPNCKSQGEMITKQLAYEYCQVEAIIDCEIVIGDIIETHLKESPTVLQCEDCYEEATVSEVLEATKQSKADERGEIMVTLFNLEEEKMEKMSVPDIVGWVNLHAPIDLGTCYTDENWREGWDEFCEGNTHKLLMVKKEVVK